MKRNILCGLLVVLLAACTDDSAFERNTIVKNQALYARIENSDDTESRVVVGNDNKVRWEKDDRIGVYGIQWNNLPFIYQKSQDDVAEFTGNLDLSTEKITLAYYPYQEEAIKDGNSLTITLPEEYVYKGNSNAPMLGKEMENGTFLFKHTCGLMRITLGNLPEDAERFVISSIGENASCIAGKAVIEDIMAEDAILKIVNEQGCNSITYHLNTLSATNEFRHFFVPLPVGDYKKLEIALYGKDKEEAYFTRSVSNIRVQRADMIEMPVINGLTGDSYVLNENVVELAAEVAEYVTLSGINKNILVISKDAPSTSIPALGQIMVSKPYENLPNGFLGRVTSVDIDDKGSHILGTEMPSLSEVFDKLYVDETLPVSFQEEEERVASRGILQNGIFTDMELSNELGVEYEFDGGCAKGSLLHTGNVIFNLQFDKENKLEYYAFTWKSNVRLGLELEVKMESEFKGLKKVLAELRGTPIPLANGLIQLFPVYSPYVELSGKGEIETKIGLETEFQPMAAALYKDGEWVQRKNASKPKANYESPWNFRSQTTFNGELLTEIGNEFKLLLYNREDLKIYLKPEIGLKIEGEVKLNNTKDTASIENAELKTSLYLEGSVGADASLLKPDDLQAELTLFKHTFWEKKVSMLPAFKELSSDVKAVDNGSYLSDVKTEMQGEVLSKEMKVELVVVDKAGHEIAVSSPVYYNGGKTKEEEPDVVVPLENSFEDLQAESEYEVFPRVTSPLFESISEGGVIDLKNKSVSFATYNSIRDVLVRIYNDCGGKDWAHQENWCTDSPISEWEGVGVLEDGTYCFDFLVENKIGGSLTIEHCKEPILLTRSVLFDPLFDVLHIENCPNLKFANGCYRAKNIYIDNICIEDDWYEDFYNCNGVNIEGEGIESVQIKNCKGYSICIRRAPNLKSFICENICFDAAHVWEECYYWSSHNRIDIYDVNELEEIKISNIKNIEEVEIVEAHSLKNVELNNLGHYDKLNQRSRCELYDVKIQDLIVRGGYDMDDYSFNHIEFELDSSICITDAEVVNLYMEGCRMSGGFRKADFSLFKGLKKACFVDCLLGLKVNFNGCTELESLTIYNSWLTPYDYGDDDFDVMDIRNTPNLRTFECCSVQLNQLLFDSHFEYVDAICMECTDLLQEFPDFYKGGYFRYDQRYSYDRDENGNLIVTDKGYGWWYPGEPEKGGHWAD